jgi:hypothetical protein
MNRQVVSGWLANRIAVPDPRVISESPWILRFIGKLDRSQSYIVPANSFGLTLLDVITLAIFLDA